MSENWVGKNHLTISELVEIALGQEAKKKENVRRYNFEPLHHYDIRRNRQVQRDEWKKFFPVCKSDRSERMFHVLLSFSEEKMCLRVIFNPDNMRMSDDGEGAEGSCVSPD